MEEQYIVTNADGDKYYYKDKSKTILHRIDGPAVEYAKGPKTWYVNGKQHRLDGPAVEWVNGDKAWFVNGKLHRLDGPAYEYTNGNRSWYVNGVFIMSVDNKGRLIDRMK